MGSLETVRSLCDAGRFLDALKALGRSTVPRTEQRAADVLKAELLERTGSYTQARVLVESLIKRPGLSSADRSSSELLLALVDWEDRRIAPALVRFERSIAIAKHGQHLERLCWAQLRLLLVMSDSSGPDALGPLIGEVRTNVIRLGQPMLAAALHVFVAQMEAKRGVLNTAKRHTSLALSWLAASGNLWLEATVENINAGLAIVQSDFDAAFVHAKRSVSLAEESGAAKERQSALVNLGTVSYLLGRFDEAINYYGRARAALTPGSDNWNACLDSLARAYMIQGDTDRCEELLDELDDFVRDNRDTGHYVHRHAQLTRAELECRQGKFDDALAHIESALTLAAKADDGLLSTMALLTKAEVLLKKRDLAGAMSALSDVAAGLSSQPPHIFAQHERVLAAALVASGDLDSALSHLERSRRVYASLRHAPGLRELDRSFIPAGQTSNVPDTLEARSPGHRAATARTIAADIAAVLLHAGRPEIVARQVVDLLNATDSVHYAAAVARSSDGTIDVLSRVGTPCATAIEGERTLLIGPAAGREVKIVFQPKPDVESVATVNALTLLLSTVHSLERARAEREERTTLWPIDELPTEDNTAVTGGHLRELMALAKRVANTNVSVLITGESGTGKEVLARAVHLFSNRAQKPFVPFNCTAVPRELLESQLFGYRRGAFTGAERDNPGVIRSARDGTLFLDEIGELGLDLQPKLLRFLESGEICPLGESTPQTVAVRVLAATNANLEGLVKDGRFREDLFYRLNVIRLSVRPLRERRDEIPGLVRHFVGRAAEEFRKGQIRLADETIERLLLYSWPGNVRQLHNELRRMIALAEPDSTLPPACISEDILLSTPAQAAPPVAGTAQAPAAHRETLGTTLTRIERELVKGALRDHHGKVDAAARALGISRKGLYLKRQRFGL
jgi:DNA-binding NtrC family response regulator/tetratricopeptide (TPR) repeat protein